MNFQPIGFLDTSMMTAMLLTRHRALLTNDPNRLVPLRSVDTDLPLLEEWKSAAGTLKRLKGLCAPALGGKPAILGAAAIVGLQPGQTEPWNVDDDPEWFRLFVVLTPSPAALILAGSDGLNPPVGQVFAFNKAVPHSAVNTGPVELIRLIVDVRNPETVQ